MSSQRLSPVESYHAELEGACPVTVTRWRVAKSLLYSFMLGSVAVLSLVYEADPTYIGIGTLLGMIVIFVGEVREIQIANAVRIKFKRNGNGD